MFSDRFDKTKSDANKAKHGIDFIEARDIWLDPAVRTVPARLTDGEVRYATIGMIKDKMWVAIWCNSVETLTKQDPANEGLIRIISAHRAEGTRWEKLYHGKAD